MALSTLFLLPHYHPCLYRVGLSVRRSSVHRLAWEGVRTAKGQTVHCLMLGAQPAVSRLCGLHQPLPPGHRLCWIPQVGAQPAPAQLGGEEAAETGFPGLTEQWPHGLPLTHIPTWLLSKEIPSPVASRWTCGCPLMCKHTCAQKHIPSPTITHVYVYACMLYSHAYTPSLLLIPF